MRDQLLADHSQHIPQDKDAHLYLYALVRKDLQMPVGKLAAQAGHAYTDAMSVAASQHPEYYNRYRNHSNGGSKVTLYVKNERQLLAAYQRLIDRDIPCSIVVDREHVLPPHFDGSPIITALGIGPCIKPEVRDILKKFQCV